MRIAARAAMILAVMILAGCSATRHVPPGKLLLDDVSVEIHDTTGTLGRQQMLSCGSALTTNSSSSPVSASESTT